MQVDTGFWDKDGEYIESIEEITMEEEKEITKEIIIDGVDVRKCEFYEFDDVLGCLCYEYIDGDGASPAYHCKDRPDCYYKQLKRLQTENERLKEKLNEWEKELQSNEKIINRLIKENEELKQALEEIREICKSVEFPLMSKMINIIDEVLK